MRKFSEQFFGLSMVSLSSFFGSVETSKIGKFLVTKNSRAVLCGIVPLDFEYAFVTEFVVISLVGLVLGMCGFSNVFPFVVGAVSVLMVNLELWKRARLQKEDQSMFKISFPIDLNCSVFSVRKPNSFPVSFFRHHPCVFIIGEKFFGSLKGQRRRVSFLYRKFSASLSAVFPFCDPSSVHFELCSTSQTSGNNHPNFSKSDTYYLVKCIEKFNGEMAE